MAGHYININGHKIFGYCRYISFYNTIVNNSEDGALFVEVGSFLGQSTAAMGKFIKDSGKDIYFHAIDLFKISEFSDSPHSEHAPEDFFDVFWGNMISADVDSFVEPIIATSLEAAAQFEDRSISFLMIDASHRFKDVQDDIKAWWPKIKLGGIISGDDYDWEEVKAAVDNIFPNVSTFDNTTWYLRKNTIDL